MSAIEIHSIQSRAEVPVAADNCAGNEQNLTAAAKNSTPKGSSTGKSADNCLSKSEI